MKTYQMTWDVLELRCSSRWSRPSADEWQCSDSDHVHYHMSRPAFCRESLCPLLKDLPAAECGRCEEVERIARNDECFTMGEQHDKIFDIYFPGEREGS
jgi:hypothetical protein